jgi:membrane-associated phospholipid phosphatase
VGARRSVIALWITLAAVGSALAIAARGTGPLPGDLALTRWLQGLVAQDHLAGSLLAYQGRVVWLLPVAFLAVTLVRRRWLAALFVLVAGFTGLLAGDALKLLVARPRPSAGLVRVYDVSDDHGFPSTTALLSVVLLGMVCYLAGRERPWPPFVAVVVGVSLMLVLASGISRVYLGEHWTTDVLGGWLFGGAWLILLIAIHRRLTLRHTPAWDRRRG